MPFIQPPSSPIAATPPLDQVLNAAASATRLHGANTIDWNFAAGGNFRIDGPSTIFGDENGNELLTLGPGIAAAVNDIGIVNAIAGGSPIIEAIGGDADITLILRSKGTGEVILRNGTSILSTFTEGAGAPVNFFTFSNAPTGSSPTLETTGTDASVNLQLRPKGVAGSVRIIDNTANELAIFGPGVVGAVNEITIVNAVTGSPPTLSATGSDVDIDFSLAPKGAGLVRFSGTLAPAPTTTKVAAYTVTPTDFLVPADTAGGGFTITLPATPRNGQIVNIKKTSTDANTLTISGNGNTIDGAASLATAAVNRPNFQLQFQTANTDWRIL